MNDKTNELRTQLIEALKHDVTEVEARLAAIDADLSARAADVDAQIAALRDAQRAADGVLLGERQQLIDARRAIGRELKSLGVDPPATVGFPCSRCDRTFQTKQGVTMHNTRTHADEVNAELDQLAAKALEAPTVAPVEAGFEVFDKHQGRPNARASISTPQAVDPDHDPDPPPETVDDDVRAIRCDDCEAAFANPRRLHNHVYKHHGRDKLSRLERVPRVAVA